MKAVRKDYIVLFYEAQLLLNGEIVLVARCRCDRGLNGNGVDTRERW